jgi:TonB family protein
MKNAIGLFLVSWIISITASAQDTVWIAASGAILASKDSAERYNLVYRNSADTQQVKVIRYLKGGSIQEEVNYLPYSTKTLHGPFRKYTDGRLADERIYSNNLLEGAHKTFWENGNIKRNDIYEKGNFVSGKCFGFNGGDTTWFAYQIRASFPGGTDSLRQYLARYMKYPADARRQGIDGTVKVKFTITKDGSLSDIQLLNNVNPFLDQEALRLVNAMPKWVPARLDGREVNMSFILPVAFRLMD